MNLAIKEKRKYVSPPFKPNKKMCFNSQRINALHQAQVKLREKEIENKILKQKLLDLQFKYINLLEYTKIGFKEDCTYIT